MAGILLELSDPSHFGRNSAQMARFQPPSQNTANLDYGNIDRIPSFVAGIWQQ
jgi:hypothetical protein